MSHVATHEIGVLFTCSITSSYTQSSVEESPPTQLNEVCKVCIMCPSDHSQVQCNLLICPIWLRVAGCFRWWLPSTETTVDSSTVARLQCVRRIPLH